MVYCTGVYHCDISSENWKVNVKRFVNVNEKYAPMYADIIIQ